MNCVHMRLEHGREVTVRVSGEHLSMNCVHMSMSMSVSVRFGTG